MRVEDKMTTWVFCSSWKRLAHDHVHARAKPNHHSQMFWAAFLSIRRTSLEVLPGNPDSKRGGVTGRVIRECLEEHMSTICGPGSVFVQDNAPTHAAAVVQLWLSDFAGEDGVELVDWPPYSPDLNPIENLWKLLKEDIFKSFPELSDLPSKNESKEKSRAVASIEWERLDDRVLESLISSMPRRVEAVVAARAW